VSAKSPIFFHSSKRKNLRIVELRKDFFLEDI